MVRSVDLIRWEAILVCKTFISLRLHIFSLPSTRLRVIMSSTSDEMENSTTQYVVNIKGNSGTVLIGRNNVANVQSPTSSSATTLLPVDSSRAEVHLIVGAENICALGFLQQLNSSISQQTSRSTDSNRMLPIGKEPTCMSKFFPVVKKRKCCHVAPSRKPRKKLNDPKRRKRNPRFSSSSSGEDLGETNIKELAFHSDGTNLEQALQYFSECITHLHPLRDNGQWDNFERVAQCLLEKNANDLPYQTIIQLEKSLVLSLQGKLEESENLINDAFKNISQLMSGAIRLLLEVLSNCYLGQLNRRRKLFGNAERCLQLAKEKSARFPPSLPLSILLYEEGGYLRDFAATIQGSKKELAIVRAKEVTKRCVELCCRLDSEQKVYTRKQHIAISRMVITNLNCETRESRSKLVPKKKIHEAKKLLETLENDYFNQTETQGAKIQRLMANVDLQYRLGNLIEARTIAEEALEIAKRLEFNLDVMPLEERLGEIHQKIIESSGSKSFREIPRINDSSCCSSKNNTPYSSEYEENS